VLSGSLQSRFCLRAAHVARLRRCAGGDTAGSRWGFQQGP
jgi:hypothetical protein